MPKRNLGWLLVAYGGVGLGVVGVVVPLLPTTPFLLLAAYAATRSSARLRWWLYRHPHFGPPIRDWQRHRAVPVRAKWMACGCLAASWASLWLLGLDPVALLGLGVFFALIAGWLLTRPSGEPVNRGQAIR